MSPHVTVALVANEELRRSPAARVAVLTSRSSGDGLLGGLDATAADLVLSMRYIDHAERHVPSTGGRPIEHYEALVDDRRLEASFDLVLVDPFHTFSSSERAYRLALRLARPGALLLSHDCAPPLEWTEPEQPARREWAGSTFAAFREIAHSFGLRWCTVDADVGIGMAIVHDRLERPRLAAPISVGSVERLVAEHVAAYQDDPAGHMRLVHPGRWREALDALRSGVPLDTLLTGAAPPPAAAVAPPQADPPSTGTVEDLEQALASAEARLAAIQQSRTWRWTAWYRTCRSIATHRHPDR